MQQQVNLIRRFLSNAQTPDSVITRRASEFPISINFDFNGRVSSSSSNSYCGVTLTCNSLSEQPKSQSPTIDQFDDDDILEDYEYNYEKEIMRLSSRDFDCDIELRSHGMDMNDGMYGVHLKDIARFEGSWDALSVFLDNVRATPDSAYKLLRAN